jgi:hypothetical protein
MFSLYFIRLQLHIITHSLMEPSPSREAANCAATRELPSILWNYIKNNLVEMVVILLLLDPIKYTVTCIGN